MLDDRLFFDVLTDSIHRERGSVTRARTTLRAELSAQQIAACPSELTAFLRVNLGE